MEVSIASLKKFHERAHKELKDFEDNAKAWMSDPNYSKGKTIIDAKSIQCYEARLKHRLNHIHEAVDSHLELLLRATKKRDPNRYKFFMSKEYKTKLGVLMQSDNLKYLNSCVAKGLKDDKNRMRIKNTTQSYHLMDSNAYEKARVME